MSDPRQEFVKAMRAAREVAVPGQQINLDVALRCACIAFADARCAPVERVGGGFMEGPNCKAADLDHATCRAALLREVGLEEHDSG